MKISLELWFAKIVGDKVLFERQETDISDTSDSPDKIVRQRITQLSGEISVAADECIIHSTSWRFDVLQSRVILTFLVYADKLNFKEGSASSLDLGDLVMANSESPSHPVPKVFSDSHVLAHALRHLSFLAGKDPSLHHYLSDHAAAKLRQLKPMLGGEIN